MRGSFLKKALLLIISISLVVGLCTPCISAATQKKTVKVAYFSLGDYYKKNSTGNIDSYDTEYLKKISEYTNDEYEYVNCGTWDNALKMLENHQVDLVGTAQWNEERGEKYAFCEKSYGYTVGELATLSKSNFIYEDYKRIGKSTVGYTKNYVRKAEMEEVFKKHNISPKRKTYDTQEQVEIALEKGEIDIIAANSHTLQKDWTPVEKFSYSPFYFISWKGNEELIKSIDDGIIKTNLYEPKFDDTLLQQKFPHLIGTPFTKSEYDLIDKKETYTIYFDGNLEPLSWYDEKTEKMEGVLVSISQIISKNTGMKFKVKEDNGNVDMTDSNNVRYKVIYNGGKINQNKADGTTDAIVEENYNLYRKVGNTYEEGKPYVVAILKNREGLKEYIEKKYPKYSVKEFETPKKCIESVARDNSDFAFLNVHVAETALLKYDENQVAEMPTAETTFQIALKFYGKDRAKLASIANKGIQLIDKDEVNNIMLEYAINVTPQVTFLYWAKTHTGVTVAVCIGIILLLLALTAAFTYAKVMRKERDLAENIDAERTEFFARMSHDMRTPMNGILGMMELTENATDLNEVKANMGKAKLAGDYMLNLINDTLDLQRLESEKLKIEPQLVNVKEFTDSIIDMSRITAEQKNIELFVERDKINLDGYVNLDPVRVKQIFMNLISNAIKFTPEGGLVEIKVDRISQTKNNVKDKIVIKDTGIGMSREFVENELYKAYAQEKNEMSNNYAGSGLGLAITKNLVKLMNGTIVVSSKLGEGTTFTVYLDFELVDKEVAQKSMELHREKVIKEQVGLKGKKILLCEDHPLNAEIAKKLLEKVGCIVTWAKDGEEGIEKFADSEICYFDSILMDIRMPKYTGLEATKMIRQMDRKDAKSVPIFAMTANAYDEDVRRAKEAGMDEHISKPIDPEILYSTLAKYM